jgi:hypothetical protein
VTGGTSIADVSLIHPKMLQALSSSKAPSELLLLLKELKNSVIGNTARKVELAKEKGLASQ